jgi:filamentous hemagglutinin family protein
LGSGVINRRCWRRFRGNALGTVSIIPFLATGSGVAVAQPVGASVVAGRAQISSSGATTVVDQSTNKAIINWQDFSVGAGAAVQFNQPNSTSITLNRVTGSSLSTIDGSIRANGQVWLLNPNGLLFGGNAIINVGGLLATTSDIANQDFIEGRYNFAGGRNSIVNNGRIEAASGGSVILSAPKVVNNGLIQANAGHVVLGGTDTFTVDFDGDHLLSYAVGNKSTGGTVANRGKIQAQGGKVLLTARAASGVQDAVVNNSGMVEATSVREENGEIILEAEGGGVANSGTLDASGKSAGETGGTVKVLGQQVAVIDGARIDVSGNAGGGTALIGGNFHGAGPEQNAQNTSIGKASIKADANSSGNGGKVAVWSNGHTQFAGSISARGGAASGNGGKVETSGHTLGITGSSVDAAEGGQWLLDPYDLAVDSSAAATINSSLGGNTSVLLQTTASGTTGPGLANASGNGDIFINAPISWGTSATLTLNAYRNIQFNANVTNSGAGTLAISTGIGTSGDYNFAPGSSISFASEASNPVLRINSSVYTLLYSPNELQNINTNNASLGARYALATSSDATNVSNWVPIGTDGLGNPNNFGNGFTGVFTGLGNTISNLSISSPYNLQGLFGYASGGVIRDTGMVSATISGGNYVGALAGQTGSGEAIFNSYAKGTVSGSTEVGGLVGQSGGSITNSYATDTVTANGGSQYAGGLVGINTGSISTSFTSGSVSDLSNGGGVQIGGLVGQNNGPISNSYSTAVVNGTANTGGLVGINNNSVTSSYSASVVTGGNHGGLIGGDNGTVTSSYWDTDNTKTDNSRSGATGLTTAQLSGALPSGFSLSIWANVGNQTTPYLPANQAGSVLIGSLNNIPFSLIFTMAQLQAVNNNLLSGTSNYALANSLDASNTTNFVPLGVDASGNIQGSGLGFGGFFDGLGYTISNLAISRGASNYQGLFGYSSGIISNVGMVGGSVTAGAGAFYVGALVGYQNGNSINNSFAKTTVRAGSGSAYVGGLVGDSTGSITNSYATGAVSGGGGGNGGIGGLIGQNDGSMANVYAMGAVTLAGGGAFVGGLAGLNNGSATVDNAYSTGAVSAGAGATRIGGLVGQNGSTITNSVWDTLTSGQPSGVGNGSTSGVTGLATAQLQGTLPTGFSSDAWGTGSALYPYLLALYPNTPQAISGIAYSNAGVTPLASTASGAVTVSALVNGTRAGSSTTGANGYYYILNPAGTFSGSQQVLTYLDGNAIAANSYMQNPSASVTGADLYASDLRIASGAGTVSSMFSGLSTAIGTNSGANYLYSGGNITSGTNLDIISSNNGGLSIDAAISLGLPGSFSVNAMGPITQSGGITAQNLTLSTTGSINLSLGTNQISGTLSLNSGGDASFTNGLATVLGKSFVGGTLTVRTAGNLTVAPAAALTVGNANLDAGGSIILAPGSAITASTPSTISLAANDPNMCCNLDSNGISGTGVLKASIFNLQAGPGANGLSGSIGTAANPLTLTSDSSSLSLAVRSFNGNVYLSSSKPVSIDPGAANVNGINTQGSNGNYGEVSLIAAGFIRQTYGIQSGNLMLTSTGSNAAIALTDTGKNNDPGNTVFGTVHLYSSGSAIYSAGFANTVSTNLGASTVSGNLLVTSTSGDIRVQDPNGGTLSVGGTTQLVAGTGHGIVINSPLVSGSDISLLADLDVSQNTGTSDAHIRTGGNLFAQSNSGGVFLKDAGCSGGGGCVADAGNQVGGFASFNGAGNVVFGASTSLTLGSVTAGNGGKIKVVTGGDLTLANGTVLSSSLTSGYSIQLVAAGRFINNAGANALHLVGSGNFAIFSASPAGDVFGNLNSGNTAIWGTTFSPNSGPPPFNVTGNRYVFAQPATVTVSANSATKVYGVNATASVQNGFVISGLQSGVANAFLADTAAVYSGAPSVTSTGAGATAGVGSYVIAAGAGSFAATNGYTVAFQNNILTVTPATLAYIASAASRNYGAANPAFGGAVTGFVNSDTLVSATSGALVFATTATAVSPLGSYAIIGSGLLAANYIFIQARGNATALTINPAILLYAANAGTRVYGAANLAFSGTVSGFVNGDTLISAASGTLVFATAATAASGVGSYGVNGSGLSAANYIFAQAPGNASALTINPATLLYVANTATRAVGDPNPAFSGSVNGFVNGDIRASATSGALVFATPATATSPAGSYAINGSGLLAANYVFAQASGNATALTINPDVAPTPPSVLPATTPQLPDTTSPVLTGFTAAIQPPPLNGPLNTILGNSQTAMDAPPPSPPPPSPPSPPPPPLGGSPLAANNTTDDGQPVEAPHLSDQVTNEVADSLDGGLPPTGEGGGLVIPKMLVKAPPPPPPPIDVTALPSFGNSSLWQ